MLVTLMKLTEQSSASLLLWNEISAMKQIGLAALAFLGAVAVCRAQTQATVDVTRQSPIFALDLSNVPSADENKINCYASSSSFALDTSLKPSTDPDEENVYSSSRSFALCIADTPTADENCAATSPTFILNLPWSIEGAVRDLPESWLDELAAKYSGFFGADVYKSAFAQKFGSNFNSALRQPTGKRDANGLPLLVWHDFVGGTNPLDENDIFSAVISFEDGKPNIKWRPELTESEMAKRVYRILGKVDLSDKDWTVVNEGEEGCFKFFKVTVEMKQ